MNLNNILAYDWAVSRIERVLAIDYFSLGEGTAGRDRRWLKHDIAESDRLALVSDAAANRGTFGLTLGAALGTQQNGGWKEQKQQSAGNTPASACHHR